MLRLLRTQPSRVSGFWVVFVVLAVPLAAQQGGRGGAPATPRAAAPIDLTGYWASLIVDEWRYRVAPLKGDVLYVPINQRAREEAQAWDPAKDAAAGQQCRAYGAVGVMQRPGRLHITWQDDNALKIETDAGTQTRLFHFGVAPSPDRRGEPSLQGYTAASWQVLPGRRGGPAPRAGQLRAITTNLSPGYLRLNGVPYSANTVLTEYFAIVGDQDGQQYLVVTATVEDPTYLDGPFIRSYTFKKETDGSKWDPTGCLNR